MRKLGLVGGTGPESTIAYYRSILGGVQAAAGIECLPEMSIESLSVFQVWRFCSDRDWQGLCDYLLGAVRRLAAAGVELGSLTGLTPHIVFDRLRAASPIPLISAIEATRDAAIETGATRLALLGTEYTMTEDFFAEPLREAGFEIIIPLPGEVAYIQATIARELEHGQVTNDALDGFTSIIRRLRDEENVQRVILGCTELPLLLNDDNSPLPCLDVLQIHSQALVAAVIDG